MSLFKRKTPSTATPDVPDETTIDRAKLLDRQHAKLRRAEDLKRRSSAVAASLQEESSVNHYIERLRLAYAEGSR